MKANEKLAEFLNFASSLKKTDNIGVVYDSDPDGLTSAVIVCKSIQRKTGKPPKQVFFQKQNIVSLQDSTIARLKKRKINKLIVLDLAVDQDAKQVKKAEKFAQILVIDHHKTYSNLSSKKTTFLKAKDFSFIDPSKYATAKLSFDLFSHIAKIDDLRWLACTGLIGDCSMRAWKNFFKTTFRENRTTKNELIELMNLISAVETVKRKNIANLFKEFFVAKKPSDLRHSKYKKYKEMVKNELKKVLNEFKEKKEIFPKQELVFFKFKSKFDIKSILVNMVSTKYYPDKTVVVVEDKGHGILTISARRQDFKIKMNDLLEKAVRNLPKGMAGGHIPAAGGKIEKPDFEKFKKNILRILTANA